MSIYVCGFIVYDCVYLGNVCLVVVFDILNCLMNYVYGVENVIYVCNFIDVDDKINVMVLFCKEVGVEGMLEELIVECIEEIIGWYLGDMVVFGVLEFDYMLCVM